MPGSNPPSAAIFGCAGPILTEAEKAFFAETDPLGFILFVISFIVLAISRYMLRPRLKA